MPSTLHMRKMLTALVITPDVIPTATASACFFSRCSCLYNGIARQTVAGVRSQLR